MQSLTRDRKCKQEKHYFSPCTEISPILIKEGRVNALRLCVCYTHSIFSGVRETLENHSLKGVWRHLSANGARVRKSHAFLCNAIRLLEIWSDNIAMDRKQLFNIIERDSTDSKTSKIYDWFMMTMIVVSILPLMFRNQNPLFVWMDRVSVAAFIIDYLCRWITADLKHPLMKRWEAFILYPITPMAIIDMMSILPSLGLFSRAFKVLRVLRIMKLARVIRLLRYSRRIQTLAIVLKKESHVLLTVLGIAVFYIFTTALIMFNVEMNNTSETGVVVFNDFFDALYWATTTLTTVGYGDVYPVSDFGRVVSMISSVFGVAIIALPSGVITASYLEELRKNKNNEHNNSNLT